MRLRDFFEWAKERKNWDDAALAAALDLKGKKALGTLENIASGRKRVSIYRLEKLLTELNLTFEDCFSIPENREQQAGILGLAQKILERGDKVSGRLEGFIQALAEEIGLKPNHQGGPSHQLKKRTAAK